MKPFISHCLYLPTLENKSFYMFLLSCTVSFFIYGMFFKALFDGRVCILHLHVGFTLYTVMVSVSLILYSNFPSHENQFFHLKIIFPS